MDWGNQGTWKLSHLPKSTLKRKEKKKPSVEDFENRPKGIRGSGFPV